MFDTNENPKLSEKESLVLGLLLQAQGKEMYGLELVDQSKNLLKRGTIYVTLQRMEEKGLVESRQEPRYKPEVGIPRRKYKATGVGERAFCEYRERHQLMLEILAFS